MDPEMIAEKLAAVEMTPIPSSFQDEGSLIDPDAKYATHKGLLEIPGMSALRVYVLNTGERVFEAADVEGFFARLLTADKQRH